MRVFVVLLALAGVAAAQEPWFRGFGGAGEGSGMPVRFPSAADFDGGFNFCRLMYRSVRRHQRGLGWGTDYPHADMNLSIRLGELTRARVSARAGEPNHVVVRPTDEWLSHCPFVVMSDAGSAGFNEADVAALRAYLLKGGFLWADDFWGPWAWQDFANEIGKVLPPADYPIQELTREHPIFRTMFEVEKIPQVPSIQFWWGSSGETSEMGAQSAVAHMAAISDARGHVMVLMTHNTDISDAWEREAEDPDFFYNFSPQGYAVGLNVVLYAMSH
ncbi:MAG: DUF4159 domain-containing protein [Acidobacteria bacterium]|nr:DUF4159 domain-containing protein [Acidobacteriota bacterium]